MSVENKYKELEAGQEFKFYPYLCEFLEEPVKTGKAKTLQLKDFERYFAFFKDGRSYIICQVFDEPLEKEDNRSAPHSEFVQYLLLNLLIREGGSIQKTTNQILQELDILKSKYLLLKGNLDTMAKTLNVNTDLVREIYELTDSSLRYLVKSCLDKLESKSLLYYKKETIVYDIEKQTTRIATDNDLIEILNAELIALKNLGMRDKKQLFINNSFDLFNKQVKKELEKANANISYYYLQYNVILSTFKDGVERESFCLMHELDDYEADELILKSKHSLSNQFHTNAVKRNTEAKEESSKKFGKQSPKIEMRASESYVKDCDKVIRQII